MNFRPPGEERSLAESLSISVIIPLFNREKYIQRALRSAISQILSAHEVVVVDDGSTDHGAELVRSIADPRVRLISQENSGVGAARNRGAAVATGNLLAFLDADDEWCTGFLQALHKLFFRFPQCGIYSTAFSIIEPNGRSWCPSESSFPDYAYMGILDDYFMSVMDTDLFCSSSVAVPAKIFHETGGFARCIALGEDLDLWARLALDYSVAFSAYPLAMYHKEADGRACARHKHSGEKLVVNHLRQLLEEGRVQPARMESLREYMARQQIEAAAHCVLSGDPVTARKLLSTCHTTIHFLREWRHWWRWSRVPGLLIAPLAWGWGRWRNRELRRKLEKTK